MGLFSKRDAKPSMTDWEDEKGARTSAKALEKAAKKKLRTEGAVAGGYDFTKEGGDRFLLVFADRVEIQNRGALGSLTGKGASTGSIPLARVSSVETSQQGMYGLLTIHTAGQAIEFRTDVALAPYLARVIRGLIQGAEVPLGAATTQTTPDPAEQLRKLGELHAAGVLTDDEFAAKKAELLDRM